MGWGGEGGLSICTYMHIHTPYHGMAWHACMHVLSVMRDIMTRALLCVKGFSLIITHYTYIIL